MNVQPELLDHPKYLKLKRKLGDRALEVLLRLWSHCQANQRGEYWPAADAEYVELVCRWEKKPSENELFCFTSLCECGWVEVLKKGLRIHDWDEANKNLIVAWAHGRLGGRPRKQSANGSDSVSHGYPDGNPQETPGFPTGNPTETAGVTYKEDKLSTVHTHTVPPISPTAESPAAGVQSSPEPPRSEFRQRPTLEQVLTYFKKFPTPLGETPEELTAAWHSLEAGVDEQGRWPWGRRSVGDWRSAILTRVAENRKKLEKQAAANVNDKVPRGTSVAGAIFAAKEQKNAIAELIANHPANPDSSSAVPDPGPEKQREYVGLLSKMKELTKQIALGVRAAV